MDRQAKKKLNPPDPWEICPWYETEIRELKDNPKSYIIFSHKTFNKNNTQVARDIKTLKIAHLISSAPQLKEACELALTIIKDGKEKSLILKALEKSEGK